MTYGLPFPTPEYCPKCKQITRVYPDVSAGQVVVKCAPMHHVVRHGATRSAAGMTAAKEAEGKDNV